MEKATTDRSSAAATSGLLLVDKPAGVTSHDVVSVVRRAVRTRRVGHTGTLDPFATGLLVVLVGRGTRLIPYVEGEPKVYDAVIRFGAETDTDDGTGTVTRIADAPADAAISAAITRLTGTFDQLPPDYSAKQVGGRRAYEAARAGTPLELAPVRVTVNEWELLGHDDQGLRARITCGGGTYIRALARDLGRLAGSAAHLVALRRVRSGPFDVASAVDLDALTNGQFTLLPLRDAIPSLPARALDAPELGRVRHGNPVALAGESGRIALTDERGELLAVAEPEGAVLQPRLVLLDG